MPSGGVWGGSSRPCAFKGRSEPSWTGWPVTTQGLPKRSVLCVVDRVPGTLRGLYTASQGSYLTRLIEIAGGRSIAPPATSNYGRIGKEAVVTLNPEVVIDMVQGAQGRLAEDPIGIWSALKEIRAVRRRRVHPVREMFVLHASQFVAKTAELFSKLIHPGGVWDRCCPANPLVPTNAGSLIEARGLHFAYRADLWVVQNVSLQLERVPWRPSSAPTVPASRP